MIIVKSIFVTISFKNCSFCENRVKRQKSIAYLTQWCLKFQGCHVAQKCADTMPEYSSNFTLAYRCDCRYRRCITDSFERLLLISNNSQYVRRGPFAQMSYTRYKFRSGLNGIVKLKHPENISVPFKTYFILLFLNILY